MIAHAAKVVTKKSKQLEKSKLKKTIKNVICRPDSDFWPAVSEQQCVELAKLIRKHKVKIPEFNKLPWSVLKTMDKSERPRQKRFQNVPGFILGLAQCAKLMKSGECSCIIIDGGVTPRILVTHIIEAASENKIPIVCMANLKKVTTLCFGFPSCCVALNKDETCENLKETVKQYWSNHVAEEIRNKEKVPKQITAEIAKPNNVEQAENSAIAPEIKPFQYLTRTSKTYRAFVPPNSDDTQETQQEFSGQNYIKFNQLETQHVKMKPAYKGMIIKRYSNNPNRKKIKVN